MSKVTEWFDGDVKPVRTGIYQRDFPARVTYSYWNDRKGLWFGYASTPEAALRLGRRGLISEYQDKRWRGRSAP